jgi:hypothetical protein
MASNELSGQRQIEVMPLETKSPKYEYQLEDSRSFSVRFDKTSDKEKKDSPLAAECGLRII